MTAEILSRGEWLAVSTQGFSEQNKGRPLAHVLKELVQNGLDAIGTKDGGLITLDVRRVFDEGNNALLELTYTDNGHGAESLKDLNVVFLTSKKDTVTQRGRMGRGFKELLSLAKKATVKSKAHKLRFEHDAGGTPIVTIEQSAQIEGFVVHITVAHQEAHDDFFPYFASFLLPPNVTLRYSEAGRSRDILARSPSHIIPATLTTERFVDGRWLKPNIATHIELYPVKDGETALIYEMGIPICPVEWTQPFHVNVQQRCPQNPNRDAVMSGYPEKLHRAALPTLLKQMTADETRESWVGDAAAQINDPDLQKAVVHKAFGENVARSTPGFGRFSHDDDATEKTDAVILHTTQLTGGFKKLVHEHIPSSKQVVEAYQAQAVAADPLRYTAASVQKINPAKPKNELEKKLVAIGLRQVVATLAFAENFCFDLLTKLDPEVKLPPPGVATLVNAWATWRIDDALTLNVDELSLWAPIVNPDLMEVLIHETGHRFAFHHGKAFHAIIERLAGQAAAMLLLEPKYSAKILDA